MTRRQLGSQHGMGRKRGKGEGLLLLPKEAQLSIEGYRAAKRAGEGGREEEHQKPFCHYKSSNAVILAKASHNILVPFLYPVQDKKNTAREKTAAHKSSQEIGVAMKLF